VLLPPFTQTGVAVRDALKNYLAMASGVAQVPRQGAVTAARALVAQGEATAEQVGALVEDLLEQTRQNRDAVIALVGFEVDRALARVGLASGEVVTGLLERVRALEAEVRALTAEASHRPASSDSQPAKKAPARKAPAKKAPARKAPARKAPARKAPAKKAPVRKTPAKRAPAKKAPVGHPTPPTNG